MRWILDIVSMEYPSAHFCVIIEIHGENIFKNKRPCDEDS